MASIGFDTICHRAVLGSLVAHGENIVLDIKIILCDENLSKPFVDTKVIRLIEKKNDPRKILFAANVCAYRHPSSPLKKLFLKLRPSLLFA